MALPKDFFAILSHRRAGWFTFARGAAGTGVAVAARALGSLILNKLVAVFAPAGGLTMLAQFQNLMAMFTTLPNDGVHVGLVKYLAPLRPGSPRYRAWLGAAVVLNLGLLVTAGLVGWWVTPGIGWLGWAVLTSALVLVTAQALLGSAMLAAGKLRAYALASIALAVSGTAGVAVALYLKFSMTSVLLMYVLGQGLALGPVLVLAMRAGLLQELAITTSISRLALRGLSQFLLMAGSTLLFGKAVDFALRSHLIVRYGAAHTDLWQAVVKLSDNYTMVAGALFSSVFYPRLAALVGKPQEARGYVFRFLLVLAPMMAGGLGLVFLLRDWLLPLLFSPRLLGARYLLAPQLLGDWAKLMSWGLIFHLVARAQTWPYIAVQAISAVVFVALLGVLLPAYGLEGALWANTGRYFLLLAGCIGWEMWNANKLGLQTNS